MKAILLVASLVSATPLSIARTERREEQAPMRAATSRWAAMSTMREPADHRTFADERPSPSA
jgi:hypothetical protein